MPPGAPLGLSVSLHTPIGAAIGKDGGSYWPLFSTVPKQKPGVDVEGVGHRRLCPPRARGGCSCAAPGVCNCQWCNMPNVTTLLGGEAPAEQSC